MRCLCAVFVGTLLASAGAQAAVVSVNDSTATWLGYMNVFNRPSDGGAFQFGSNWGTPDLVATFNDGSHTLALSPNTIGDPNPYWYIGGGGPGAQGNKIMDANLYIQVDNGSLSGQTVTFQGNVLSNTFTSAHATTIFIKDFAPDFSSFNTVTLPATAGPFSISLATAADPTRHVQWGFETVGPDVWFTDTAPFGSVVIGTVPAPASVAMLGLTGSMLLRRRRR